VPLVPEPQGRAVSLYAARNPNLPITSHQLLYIRTLCMQLELPDDRLGVLHRDLWRQIGAAWTTERPDFNDALRRLTKSQASALIQILRARLD